MANLKTVMISASVLSAVFFFLAFGLTNLVHKSDNATGATQTANDRAIVTFYPESLIINAEVADNETEIETGLMFRKSLGKNEGMLFVFPDSAVRNFWMKNTLIPLDIVFISEDFTVVKIHHAMPCQADPCPLYNSGQPVKYVLEVHENLTTAYGIKEGGSRVEIIR
ncbi:DUF192 domain-containing protein [Candidatus Woesearchaeota archaeon]|nr:DUF192 domain-containing protein [Candidatus Woesearchaeota archaeon]